MVTNRYKRCSECNLSHCCKRCHIVFVHPSRMIILPHDCVPADNPFYVLHYVGRYYAFNLEGKLITKFCSDGYARYFEEKRLSSMKTKITGKISQLCAGTAMNVTFSDRIYSEYTVVRTPLVMGLSVCLSVCMSVCLTT